MRKVLAVAIASLSLAAGAGTAAAAPSAQAGLKDQCGTLKGERGFICAAYVESVLLLVPYYQGGPEFPLKLRYTGDMIRQIKDRLPSGHNLNVLAPWQWRIKITKVSPGSTTAAVHADVLLLDSNPGAPFYEKSGSSRYLVNMRKSSGGRWQVAGIRRL